MSDRELRELERRAQQSGSPTDVEAYLLARLKASELSASEWYRLGAAQLALGRPAADRLQQLEVQPLSQRQEVDAEAWRRVWSNYRRLVREAGHHGPTKLHTWTFAEHTAPEAALRRDLAAARHLLGEWEAMGWVAEMFGDQAGFGWPRKGLEAALAWARGGGDRAALTRLHDQLTDLHGLLDSLGFDDANPLALTAVDSVLTLLCRALDVPDPTEGVDPLIYLVWRGGSIGADRDPGGVVGALRAIRDLYVGALLPWALGLGDPALAPLAPAPAPPGSDLPTDDARADARTDAEAARGIAARLESGHARKLDVRLDALRGCRASRLALPGSRGLERWDPFVPLVAAWYRDGLRRGCGRSEGRVDLAEERLGLELPLVLWELYRLVGARAKNWAHDRVFSLDGLEVDDGRLCIGERDDGLRYTVRLDDLEQDDPPVLDGAGRPLHGSLAELLMLVVFRDTVLQAARASRLGPLGRLAPNARAEPLGELPLLWSVGDQTLRGDATCLLLQDGEAATAIARA